MQNITITGIEVYALTEGSKPVEDSTMPIPRMGKLILNVKTSDPQINGVGIAYLEFGLETARRAYKIVESVVVGQNPLANEAIFDLLFWRFRGARKGYAFSIISGLDIALWDIKAKVAKMPLYQFMGGNKTKLPVYASGGWTSYSTEELLEEVTTAVANGYKHVKIKVGYERGMNPKEDVRRVAAVRKAIGDDVALMIDANNAWTAGIAAKFAQDVEEYDITWFEEPTIADDYEGLAYVRSKTNIPLATGEHEFTRFGARDLVLNKAVDIFQADVCRCGGFTELIKMNAVAQAWNLLFAPHCIDLVHIHMLSGADNGMILERLLVEDKLMAMLFPDAPAPKDGMLEVTDLPGLGLLPDWDRLKAYQE